MYDAKKIVISTIFVILLIVGVAYTTYAFLTATTTKTGITGASYNASFSVSISTVYKATKLIPVTETVLNSTVNKTSDNCRDSSSRDTCSLYKVDVKNGTVAINLTGFVKTTSSTYTTSNLKYKVFTKSGNTYTAVTDAMTINHTADSSVYFKKNSANYTISVAANATQTYYIAFWINETSAAQDADQSKTYSCKVGFEGIDGSQLSIGFNA